MWNIPTATEAAPESDAMKYIKYTNAKVLLVGETGVLTLLATVLSAGFILYRLRQRGSLVWCPR